jgi:hypothetical protein
MEISVSGVRFMTTQFPRLRWLVLFVLSLNLVVPIGVGFAQDATAEPDTALGGQIAIPVSEADVQASDAASETAASDPTESGMSEEDAARTRGASLAVLLFGGLAITLVVGAMLVRDGALKFNRRSP